MAQAKNLRNISVYPDGAYNCTIDLYDDWTQTWEAVIYVARKGDPAPVNKWIIEQIETKQFDPIPLFEMPNN